MNTTDDPVIITQEFAAPLETVWSAITEVAQMRHWFLGSIPAFEPRVGFETEFIVEVQDRIFPHLWKIIEVVPNSKIVYRWRYGGYEGDSNVIFELHEGLGKTTLTLTHRATAPFSTEIALFTRESAENAWKYFIQKRLKAYMAKTYPKQ